MSDPKPRNVAVEARRAFADWVSGGDSGRVFGEVFIERVEDGCGGFSVRHCEDREVEGLTIYRDPREAREISRLTATGEYRPLKSAPDLRRGWRLDLSGESDLSVAMGYLYPAGVVHWYLERIGGLAVTSFRENAARQSGIYERVRHLSDVAVRDATAACCEDSVCLKRRLWDLDGSDPLPENRGEGEIPCPEPCSVFVSFARKVRSFEREERYADGPGGLTPSEREDVTALLDAASSGGVEFARQAEFDSPLNLRRLRYRAATLRRTLEEG